MQFLLGEESSLRRTLEGSKVRRQSVESGFIVGGIGRHPRVLRHALRILHVGCKLLRSLSGHRGERRPRVPGFCGLLACTVAT